MSTFLSFVAFAPTLVFLLIMLVTVLLGVWRGLSKSIKLLINCAVCTVIAIILYFILINAGSADENVVNVANWFLTPGGLQRTLQVSEENKTLTSILIEYIPKQTSYGDGLSLVLAENKEYLMTLVAVAYHSVMAIISWLAYLVLLLIAYIAYLIFYPERRRKRKILESVKRRENIEKAEEERKSDIFTNSRNYLDDDDEDDFDDDDDDEDNKRKKNKSKKQPEGYKPHRLGGAGIGVVRGLLSSFVVLSFFGSFCFLLTGGIDVKEQEAVSFGDEGLDNAYSYINEYDDYGIYAMLNGMHTNDNMPFYLFAANIVLSANLNDDANNIHSNVSILRETSAYVAFARNTLTLVNKYSDTKLQETVNKKDGSFGAELQKVFANEDFIKEFNQLIDEFDARTYYCNLAFSFVNSFVAHIDEMNIDGLSPQAIELIKIMFKEGYLSEEIPAEKELKLERDSSANPSSDDYKLASIKPSHLLVKSDTATIFQIVFKILGLDTESMGSSEKTITLMSEILPYLKQLSIFSSDRASELNPVYQRLYNYLDASVLSKKYTKEDQKTVSQRLALASTDESINWIEELNSLVDFAQSTLCILKNVYKGEVNTDMMFDILDSSKPYYNENLACFNTIKSSIQNSKLLDMVLNTEYIRGVLQNVFSGINDKIVIPEKIKYTGEDGELKHILPFVEALLKNKEIKTALDNLSNSSASKGDIFNSLGTIINGIGKENFTEVCNSQIFSSVISQLVMSLDSGSFVICVPNYVVHDGVIDKSELITMMNVLLDLIPEEFSNNELIKSALRNVDKLTDSKIVTTTLAYYFNDTLIPSMDNVFIVDEELTQAGALLELKENEDNIWISEIKALLNGMANLINADTFDISDTEGIKNTICDTVLTLEDDKVKSLYDSRIIALSMTKVLDDVYGKILSEEIRNGIKVDGIYDYNELSDLLVGVKSLGVSLLNIDTDNLANLVSIDNILDLYKAKLNKYSVTTMLEKYLTADVIDKEFITSSSTTTSLGYYLTEAEIYNIVNAFNVLDLKITGEIELSKVLDETKIPTIYKSTLIRGVISKKLSEVLAGQNISDFALNEVFKADSVATTKKSFTEEELINLIKSVNSLDLDVNTMNIDADELMPKIGSSIDTLYESILIMDIVTSNMDKVIDDNTMIVADPDAKVKYKSYDTYYVYSKEELKALADFVKETGKTVSTISTDIEFTNELIAKAVASKIITATISDSIYGVSGLIIPASAVDSTKIIKGNPLINKDEIEAVCYFVKETGAKVDTLSTDIVFTDALIEKALASKIVSATMSDTIYGIADIVIPASAVDSTQIINGNPLIINEELEAVAQFAKATGMKVSAISTDIEFTDELIEKSIASKIVSATMSDTIYGIADIVIPASAVDSTQIINGNPLIISEELEKIAQFAKATGMKVSAISTDIKFTDELITKAVASKIVSATISDSVSEISGLVIPASVVDNTQVINGHPLVNGEELENLLKGVAILDSKVSEIDISTMGVPGTDKTGVLGDSVILRASIANKIDSDTDLFIASDCSTLDKDSKTGNTIIVLTKSEFISLFKAIKIVNSSNSFTVSLDYTLISGISVDDMYIVFESSIMAYLVSKIVQDQVMTINSVVVGYSQMYMMTESQAAITIPNHGVYNLDCVGTGVYRFHSPTSKNSYCFTTVTGSSEIKNYLTADDVNAFVIYLNSLKKTS